MNIKLVTTLTATFSAVTLWSFASPALAINLVPPQEGEINVGLGNPLAQNYIATPGFRVESLADSRTGVLSRLFVDRAGTENHYSDVQFAAHDTSTSEQVGGGYWFRPAYMAYNPQGQLLENGQLEVGTFRITFDNVMEQLLVRWFDTEYLGGQTGTNFWAYDVAGNLIRTGVVASLGSNNIQSRTFANVKSLVLDLGEYLGNGEDGVNFQMEGTAIIPPPPPEEAPEPMTIAGLALGSSALAMARRRRKALQAENN